MAFVVREEFGEGGFCSGTVVSPHLVLTAGHCVVDTETGEIHDPSGYAVVTGNANWTASPREVTGVSQILVYPNFHISGLLEGWGDAALLALSAPTAASTISLATSANAERLQAGTGAQIIGWGRTYYEQEELQTELEWAKTVVQSKGYCEGNAPGFHPLGQICTVNPPSFATGTCHGDSGGPLVAAGPGGSGIVEIGITSSGYDECSTTLPSVFTRADLIASWVKGWIAVFDPPAPPVVAPKPVAVPSQSLPRLTSKMAKTLTREALTDVLRSQFVHRRAYKASCRPTESTKQKCSVSWWKGPNDYWGNMTIYYLFENGKPVWSYRYVIRKVNDYCYWRSGHRSRCYVRVFRG
jgi:secreted trypsin-like serine protease